jgi:lauroyl/myristoyl acyltransferase
MDIKYYGICFVTAIARFIPMRFGYFLAECGGEIAFLLSTKRRNVVGNNIRRAMGVDENNGKIRRKVRCVFRNSAKNYFDLAKLSRINLENLKDKVMIEGLHHLTREVNKRKGVIIASAHLGNYEFGAHVIASRGIDMTILVEAFNSTPFRRKLVSLRQRNGVRILPVGMNGMKEGIQTLRRGGTVTIVCDRDIQKKGINVKFLGKETSFPVGAIDLALRTGAAVVPIFSLRRPNNTTSIFVEPPLKLSNIQDHDQALMASLKCLVAVLEKYIHAYPEQWVILEQN